MEEELVWVKIEGLPCLPGKISTPGPNADPKPRGPNTKYIFIFGYKLYEWVEEADLKPYLEFREAIVKTFSFDHLINAVKQADEYLSNPVNFNANADLPAVEQREDTDTAINASLESEESPKVKTPASATNPNAKTKRTKPAGNNDSFNENTSKRACPSAGETLLDSNPVEMFWGKLEGHLWWPCIYGRSTPNPKAKIRKGTSDWMFFIGSKNYAWVEVTKKKRYAEFQPTRVKVTKTKRKKINEAVKQADQYLSDPKTYKYHGEYFGVEELNNL